MLEIDTDTVARLVYEQAALKFNAAHPRELWWVAWDELPEFARDNWRDRAGFGEIRKLRRAIRNRRHRR